MLYLFHSQEFMLFFVVIFVIYWISKRFKNAVLLIASYIFYASWDWRFLSLIVALTAINYFCGLKIEASKHRKAYLLIGIISGISILGFFKYFNFFVESFVTLLNFFGFGLNYNALNIILPIGISFYTFQTLSYTIDVYRKKMSPEKNIINFSLFVFYFPQLIAGPIERAKDLLPRINSTKNIRNINFRDGSYLFIYGLFKKVVIADSLAIIVDKVFSMQDPTGTQVMMAAYAFALQIYCDFSGYSDMAKGISHFFGIELSTNFNLPYLSRTPSEFWKRWHITLSSWVRDYLYIPMGGKNSKFAALFFSMLLMGLWHGAAWHFVLWGLYWFFVIMAYRIIKPKINSLATKVLSTIVMFHITSYSWILFRGSDFGQIISLTSSLASINLIGILDASFFPLYAGALFLLVYEAIQYTKKDQLFIAKKGFYHQMIFYLVLFFLFVEIGSTSNVAFIYFQF
ncbi:MBOAT family protein [Candidatus Woesearchaeota archaeon]|nr:MBOAT family protein [Candidatus Woesearchaeota archaeon]